MHELESVTIRTTSDSFAAMGGFFFMWLLPSMCPTGILAVPRLDGEASLTKVSYFWDDCWGATAALAAANAAPGDVSPHGERDRRLLYPDGLLYGMTPELPHWLSPAHSVPWDETCLMQRAASSGSQAKGWFTKARERFLEFEKAGMRKCAASNLRDKLRTAHPAVCRKARELVPALLGESCGRNARELSTEETADCNAWAEEVLERLASLVDPSELAQVAETQAAPSTLPCGASLPGRGMECCAGPGKPAAHAP